MREGWNRATEEISLSVAELEELLRPLVAARITEAEVTSGGLANTNIKVSVKGLGRPLLIRLVVRDPRQLEKEVRISQMLSDTAPVPKVHHWQKDNPVTGHPYLIREWIDGERVETLASRLHIEELKDLALSLGATMSQIHAIKFEKAGFLDGDLQVVEPLDLGSKGMLAYADSCLANKVVRERLGDKLAGDLTAFLEEHSFLLDSRQAQPCLSHSDFGGSNVIARRQDNHWQVAAVLDWEFAFSGSPFFDFGNLLRKPLGTIPEFESWVYRGYVSTGAKLPADWRRLSLLTDLTAWLDFMTRPDVGPALTADAQQVILETMSSFS